MKMQVLKALIVDDEAELRKSVASILQSAITQIITPTLSEVVMFFSIIDSSKVIS
jgi:CheY-like chemotaxis protein